MDFGLFNTWNALYADGKVPWDPTYRGGKLLEEEAYARNFVEIDAVEELPAEPSGKFLFSRSTVALDFLIHKPASA